MNINRTNYEEYFLLYTDNELSAAERRVVEDFIQRNPDLARELTMLQQAIVTPEKEVVFRNKEALMQHEDVIHEGNYEEFFLLYADNELTNQQKARVEQFVYDHPQYQSAFELLQEVRLTADTSVLYPHKERLYRHEQGRRITPAWWKMAAAAMVLLFAGILWLNNNQPGVPSSEVVKGKQPSGQPANRQGDEVHPAGDKPVINPDTSGVLVQIDKNKEDKKAEQKPVKTRIKNDLAVNKPEETIQVKNENMVQPGKKDKLAAADKTDKTNPGLPVSSNDIAGAVPPTRETDASLANHTRKTPIIDEPAIKKDDIHNGSVVDNAMFASNDDENVFVSNIPIDNKHTLRGLFRKASRLINKNSSLKSGQKQGIQIGNIEIAFQ